MYKRQGNILLTINKTNIAEPLNIEDRILTSTPFIKVPSAKNPHQFDYNKYLTKEYIFHQIFIKNEAIIKCKTTTQSIFAYSYNLKNYIKQSLAKLKFNNKELSIIYALLLGDRNHITKEVKQNYINAGAIHILALSGLHIGIISLILSKFLNPLSYLKNGNIYKSIILIIILWGFAIFTGLSSSVIRATTMFSFIAIGNIIQKERIIEHSLITSMFFILLAKPLLLFDIGFQLSYLAVFGIIWIHPKLFSTIKTSNNLINKPIEIVTVSFSAQLAILPLSLFYFNQFPGLFLLSNLVILPFLGGLLCLGFLIILLKFIGILPVFLIDVLSYSIKTMNNIISWISNQEAFIFKNISISFWEMIALYLILILVYQTLKLKTTKVVLGLLTTIVLYQSIIFYQKFKSLHKQEFIVFQEWKNSIIGIRNGKYLTVNQSESNKTFNSIIAYKTGENAVILNDSVKKRVYKVNNNIIFKIDSAGIYNFKSDSQPIAILQYNPKINLNRLIKTLNPKQIIADGSNYKNNIDLWKQTCLKQKTPFHSTYENGAYILKE